MSGVDALLGFDYQVSYVVYKIVEMLKMQENNINKLVFDSLNEEEEDFNIYYKNGKVEFIQIKKRLEGKMWTPSDLKNIIPHYINNYNSDTSYSFVTNGSANEDVNRLKKYLKGQKKQKLSKKFFDKFRPEDCSETDFINILSSVDIRTLVMVSDNENNISERLYNETIGLLNGSAFLLKEDAATIYDKLWKYIFDLSKKGSHLDFTDLVKYTEQIGIIKIDSREWLRFPILNGFIGRKEELNDLRTLILKHRVISMFGISGIGKSYVMSTLAKKLNDEKNNVCWISCRANLTFEKLIKILGCYIETYTNRKSFLDELKSKEIGNQIELLSDIFRSYDCLLFFDSYELVNGNMKYLISEIVKRINTDDKTSIIISTTDRNQLYNEIDVKTGAVKEYIINEFSYEDFELFCKSMGVEEAKYNDIWNAIGGFPFANSMFKDLFMKNTTSNIDFSQLLLLTKEEKNQWLFEQIYVNLLDKEKSVLSYLASIDYGFGEYEKIIIEKDLREKITHSFRTLINKNMILFDGEIFYLHNVMRNLIYENTYDDEKGRIHELFVNTYGKKLFDIPVKSDDRFLSMKWGNHICKLHDINMLKDVKLLDILNLSSQERFDIWGIWVAGFPFEFQDSSLVNVGDRISALEKEGYVCKENKHWKINLKKIELKELYLIEYKVNVEYNSLAMGYIPIFEINFGYKEQINTMCQWEHCIEYFPLESAHNRKSCIIFGHNCPDGENQVKLCSNKINSNPKINELRELINEGKEKEYYAEIKRTLEFDNIEC